MDSSAEKLTFIFGAGEDRVPTPYNRAASIFDGREDTTTFRLEATGTLGTTEVSAASHAKIKADECADGLSQ